MRVENRDGKSPAYADVKLLMTREEFVEWYIREYTEFVKKHPDIKPVTDRIDNKGHYELNNIRLVTHQQNCVNTSRAKQANAPDGTKWCSKCKMYLLPEHFTPKAKYLCKECANTYAIKWWNEKPKTKEQIEKKKLYDKEYRKRKKEEDVSRN